MRPTVDVVIGIVVRDGKVLVCQRLLTTTFPGYWEFPGGKREVGESLHDCLRRELLEELALEIQPLSPLTPIEHDYSPARVRLHPFVCASNGEPRAIACQRFQWIDPVHLRDYQFPPANERLIEEVIETMNESKDEE